MSARSSAADRDADPVESEVPAQAFTWSPSVSRRGLTSVVSDMHATHGDGAHEGVEVCHVDAQQTRTEPVGGQSASCDHPAQRAVGDAEILGGLGLRYPATAASLRRRRMRKGHHGNTPQGIGFHSDQMCWIRRNAPGRLFGYGSMVRHWPDMARNLCPRACHSVTRTPYLGSRGIRCELLQVSATAQTRRHRRQLVSSRCGPSGSACSGQTLGALSSSCPA